MASKALHGVGAVLLLLGSNAFMNTAWYLHLKFHSWPIYKAIFISWAIAFFEYCLQVPANRCCGSCQALSAKLGRLCFIRQP